MAHVHAPRVDALCSFPIAIGSSCRRKDVCLVLCGWCGPPQLPKATLCGSVVQLALTVKCSSRMANTKQPACLHAQLYHHHRLAGTCDMCNASIAMWIE